MSAHAPRGVVTRLWMDDTVTYDEVMAEHADRGRQARHPGQIPLAGWRDVAARVRPKLRRDGVSLLAAGVGFFSLLATVPTMVALVSVYGLVADPADIQRTVDETLRAAPDEVRELVSSQLGTIVDSSPSGLRAGVLVGVVIALWSASSGMKHAIGALTLAYDETEDRRFVRVRGLALLLTIGGLAVAGLVVAGVVVVPSELDDAGGVSGALRLALIIVRWPLMAAAGLACVSLLYRWGPDRRPARWVWAAPGAVLASVVWVVASLGFSIYTSNFGNYNETYGALATVVVVMLWLYLSAYAVILGAEVNAELERQTVVDTTVGPERPLGERGAHVADTLGRSVVARRAVA